MAGSFKTLVFPVAGINRRFGFQQTPPFSCLDAVNVRSSGADTERDRGGSRSGLVLAFTTAMGSDPIAGTTTNAAQPYTPATDTTVITATSGVFAPWMVGRSLLFTVSGASFVVASYTSATVVVVSGDAHAEVNTAFTIAYGKMANCLASVRPNNGNTWGSWVDDFEDRPTTYYINQTHWTILNPDTRLPTVFETGGKRYAVATGPTEGGVVTSAGVAEAIDIDTSKPYLITLTLVANVTTYAKYFRIAARMNDAAPDRDQDSVTVRFNMNAAGTFCFAKVYKYVAGVETLIGGCTLIPVSGPTVDVSLSINGNTCNVYINHASVLVATAVLGAAAGKRVGFGLYRDPRDAYNMIDAFRVDYTKIAAELDPSRSFIFAAGGGTPYKESNASDIEAIGGNVNLSDAQLVDAIEWNGELLIADFDDTRYEAEGLEFSDMAGPPDGPGLKIWDGDGLIDFSAQGIDVNNDLLEVTKAGTGGFPVEGAYKIGSVAATYIQLSDVTAGNDSDVDVRVGRAPKRWNPSTGALSIWTQAIVGGEPSGIMPVGCPLIALYRNRAVLGGAKNAPHVWFMSAVGDPTNWNYGGDFNDPSRAIPGTSTDMGKIAQPLTALISYSKDYLLFGCYNELWVLRGDPGDGGTLDNLSYKTGIIWRRAWCHTPGGGVAFLSDDGLCFIDPHAQMEPEDISRSAVPKELQKLDTYRVYPMLAWHDDGIRVFLVPTSQGKATMSAASHWFFDWKRKAFWRDQFWGDHEPMSMATCQLAGVPGLSLLLGCRDGKIRRFSKTVGTDDGAPMNAYVTLGPFTDGGGAYTSILDELIPIMSESASQVDLTWSLYCGRTPEEATNKALADTPTVTGTWSKGRGWSTRPKRRAGAFMLKVGAPSGTAPWEMDSIAFKFSSRAIFR